MKRTVVWSHAKPYVPCAEAMEKRLLLDGATAPAVDDLLEDNDDFFTAAEVSAGTIEGLVSADMDCYMLPLGVGDFLQTRVPQKLAHFIYSPDHLLKSASQAHPSQTVARWIADTAGWYRVVVPAQNVGYSMTVEHVTAPTAVADASATDGEFSTKISLSWTDIGGGATYEVWRGVQSDQALAQRITSSATGQGYSDTSAAQGQAYYYWVRAIKVIDDKMALVGPLTSAGQGHAAVDDTYEENDSPQTAFPIGRGKAITAISQDEDWYRIVLSEGEVIRCSIPQNLLASLHDPAGQLICSSAPSSQGQSFEWTVQADGTYLIHVPNQSSPAYLLSTQVQALGSVLGISGASISLECEYDDPSSDDPTVRFGASAQGMGVRSLQVRAPWGEVVDSGDYLPAGWDGAEFHQRRWTVTGVAIDVDASRSGSGVCQVSLSCTYSSAAAWQTWDYDHVDLSMSTPAGPWSASVDMVDVRLAAQRPTLLSPVDGALDVPSDPTVRWQGWAEAPESGTISLTLRNEHSGVQSLAELAEDAIAYTLTSPLEDQTLYTAGLLFGNARTVRTYGVDVRLQAIAADSVQFVTAIGPSASQPTTVVLGGAGPSRLRYTDSDGSKVLIRLAGAGTARLVFDAPGAVVRSDGAACITLEGAGLELSSVMLSGTTMKSRLSVKAKGGTIGGAVAHLVCGDGPIGAVSAAAMNLQGAGMYMTGEGLAGSLRVGDLTGGADVLMAGRYREQAVRIRTGAIAGDSDITLASPLAGLRALGWQDGELTAPWAGDISIRGSRTREIAGNFGADITLTGQNASGRSVRRIAVAGKVTDSHLRSAGGAGTIAADQWDSGIIDAARIHKLVMRGQAHSRVAGDLGAHVLLSSQDGLGSSLDLLRVKGTVGGVTVRTAGGIRTIDVGAADGSDVLAGCSSVQRHADSADDFTNPGATIGRVRVRGIRGSSVRFFRDSHLSAPAFGTVSLLNPQLPAGQSAVYAMATTQRRPIGRMICRDSETGERWTWAPGDDQLNAGSDGLVTLL